MKVTVPALESTEIPLGDTYDEQGDSIKFTFDDNGHQFISLNEGLKLITVSDQAPIGTYVVLVNLTDSNMTHPMTNTYRVEIDVKLQDRQAPVFGGFGEQTTLSFEQDSAFTSLRQI